MKALIKALPWLFLALFVTEMAVVMRPKKDGEYHTREFARLPVLLNGRIQPIDSVAYNSLLQIRSTSDLPLEIVPSWKFWYHPPKLRATEWLLEVMTRPDDADGRRIFLIHHPDIISELKIGEKGVEKSGLRYYSMDELRNVADEIMEQAQPASKVKAELQTTYQRQILKLANAMVLYHRLKSTLVPDGDSKFTTAVAEFQKDVETLRAEARAGKAEKDFDKATLDRVETNYQHLQDSGRVMARLGHVLNVPPQDPMISRDGWITTGASLVELSKNPSIHPAVLAYSRMAEGYAKRQPAAFNQAVADYKQWLAPNFQKELKKGEQEFYFNDVKAFLHATIMYVFAMVVGGIGLLGYNLAPNVSESLRRSALYIIGFAFIVHTYGLIFRMILEGRPPVTNLYSSAIFIGWGSVALGLVLERIYRFGIGNMVGAVAGFVTLLIAHNLALGGDTMEMMRAVLDTNFWLATHVVVVTLGYASTFVAGLLAICYVLLGLLTPMLSHPVVSRVAEAGKAAAKSVKAAAPLDISKALTKMVYGIICFATLFSFVGTILGGIWADQSWGRFWGWDPKENGALLIVLWNATILHARWGGMVRERGLMVLAIVGNIITSFSWFGVNMLGIGLHSYGFMDSGFKWLMMFIVSQLVLIAMGLIPLKHWQSFKHLPPPDKTGGSGSAPATGKLKPA